MKPTSCLDLAGVPKELQFILKLLKREEKTSSLNPSLYQDIDWNAFIEQARHHRLYPLLYSRLKNTEEIVPEWVIKRLERDYKRNTFLMLQLSAEMEYVSKLFAEHHIRSLFLKGPVLGQELYGDISLRTSSDLDLLVPLKQLEEAERILVNLGYEKDDYIQTILSDWKWRHHHVTYIHPKKKTKLEIHWRLNPGPGRDPNFEELWKRKMRSSLTHSSTYLLGTEDLFLFLISHGGRHGWSRLRWLVDIDRLINFKPDWDKLYPLLKRYGYLHTGGQAIILANQLLYTKVSREMDLIVGRSQSQKLAQDTVFYLESMINLHSEALSEKVSRYHKHYLFASMSKRQKIIFILSFLFPYPEDAEVLPLPKKLHFLYFPLRPFTWAWRKTRKHATS